MDVLSPAPSSRLQKATSHGEVDSANVRHGGGQGQRKVVSTVVKLVKTLRCKSSKSSASSLVSVAKKGVVGEAKESSKSSASSLGIVVKKGVVGEAKESSKSSESSLVAVLKKGVVGEAKAGQGVAQCSKTTGNPLAEINKKISGEGGGDNIGSCEDSVVRSSNCGGPAAASMTAGNRSSQMRTATANSTCAGEKENVKSNSTMNKKYDSNIVTFVKKLKTFLGNSSKPFSNRSPNRSGVASSSRPAVVSVPCSTRSRDSTESHGNNGGAPLTTARLLPPPPQPSWPCVRPHPYQNQGGYGFHSTLKKFVYWDPIHKCYRQ